MNQESEAGNQEQTPYSVLKRFVRPRALVEQCDLCSEEISPEHRHLLDPATRQLVCACEACALLFSTQSETKYRSVPRRSRFLRDFHMEDAQWDDLLIPVGMAFFFYSSTENRVMAFYPSPAGPTESLLTLDAWEEVARANPVLKVMAPDVEALLVNRLKGAREYYLAPIDKCYELVGLIRANWRGLSGGQEVWQEIQAFFDRLRARSETVLSGRPDEADSSAARAKPPTLEQEYA